MSTVELAKKKWERKMSGDAPTNWKKGVTGKGANYNRGMASFLGVGSIRGTRQTAWESGVNAVSEADFKAATAGKADKWEQNLKSAMV